MHICYKLKIEEMAHFMKWHCFREFGASRIATSSEVSEALENNFRNYYEDWKTVTALKRLCTVIFFRDLIPLLFYPFHVLAGKWRSRSGVTRDGFFQTTLFLKQSDVSTRNSAERIAPSNRSTRSAPVRSVKNDMYSIHLVIRGRYY